MSTMGLASVWAERRRVGNLATTAIRRIPVPTRYTLACKARLSIRSHRDIAQDETALVARARAGDDGALAMLLKGHDAFIREQAKRWGRRSPGDLDEEDLFQEARMGAIRAIQRWDPEKRRLLKEIEWQIRRAVLDASVGAGTAVRMPRDHYYSKSQERRNIAWDAARACRLDEPISDEDDMTFGDILESAEEPAIDSLARAHSINSMSIIVERCVTCLNDLERLVFQRRRLQDDPPTLEVIAADLGCTKERVRQIETEAVAKFATMLRDLGIKAEDIFE